MAAVPACFIFDEAMSRPVHISNFSSHRLSHKPRPPKAAAKRGPPQTTEDILGAAVQVAKAKLTDASTYQKPVAGTMRRASNLKQECVICCKPNTTWQMVRPCEACAEESVCCISCVRTHTTHCMNDAPYGTTPRITCPLCPPQRNQPRRLVSHDALKRALRPKEYERCHRLGTSCLAFFCGGCHKQQQLHVEYKPSTMSRLRKAHAKAEVARAEAEAAAEARDQLEEASGSIDPINDFARSAEDTATPLAADGLVGGDEQPAPPAPCWQSGVLLTLEQLKTGALDAAAAVPQLLAALAVPKGQQQQRMFSDVLPAIGDPLARAAVAHAFLRGLAQFSTPCCRRLHCFNCHVVGGHPGLSCEQYAAYLPSRCPS